MQPPRKPPADHPRACALCGRLIHNHEAALNTAHAACAFRHSLGLAPLGRPLDPLCTWQEDDRECLYAMLTAHSMQLAAISDRLARLEHP